MAEFICNTVEDFNNAMRDHVPGKCDIIVCSDEVWSHIVHSKYVVKDTSQAINLKDKGNGYGYSGYYGDGKGTHCEGGAECNYFGSGYGNGYFSKYFHGDGGGFVHGHGYILCNGSGYGHGDGHGYMLGYGYGDGFGKGYGDASGTGRGSE
jgi:hypothetical protein